MSSVNIGILKRKTNNRKPQQNGDMNQANEKKTITLQKALGRFLASCVITVPVPNTVEAQVRVTKANFLRGLGKQAQTGMPSGGACRVESPELTAFLEVR